jgi:catechol 2,3-dioxygenase-like lactoylglutathione lyase family enzyme
MTDPRLAHVILRVASLDGAVDFWHGTLGLPIEGRSEAFAFLDAGSARIALNEVDGGDPAAGASATEVVLEVEDPRERFAAWREAGVSFQVGLRPVTEADGRSLLAAHFRDPDGHLVSLTGWAESTLSED